MRLLATVLGLVCAGLVAMAAGGAVAGQSPHSRNAEPDYARLFPRDTVKRLDLRMASTDWQKVLADMQTLAGPAGGVLNVGFSAEQISACSARVEAESCTAGDPPVHGRCVQTGVVAGQLACVPIIAPANQRGDETEILARTPAYVPVDVSLDGQTVKRAGFRFKGNSTLYFTWRRGSDKLPFRLNFDALENQFPETRDQTFFGFPNLAFTNGNLDNTYVRGKVVTDLFREAGVPAAYTTFVRVYLDRGTGPFYLGLYTMLEVPDGPMLRRHFGSDAGNLYKPHGVGGRWLLFNRDFFPKRTNQEQQDWTDIQGAIAVLHESKADRVRWRRRLEARFDVPVFLRWLALNTIIGNVDAYGGVSGHNYYVYGSPRHRDRIFWIPWDHDLAMPTGGLGTPAPGAALDLFHNRLGSNWPLIRFLLDDPVYRAAYRANLHNLLATVFEPSKVTAAIRSEHARIFPHVIGSQGESFSRTFVGSAQQFDAAVYGSNGLLNYVTNRAALVQAALAAEP